MGRTMHLQWSTDAGVVILQYPSDISEQDADDVQELFDLVMSGIVRRASAIDESVASEDTPNA